jgi:hypothetical protein
MNDVVLEAKLRKIQMSKHKQVGIQKKVMKK